MQDIIAGVELYRMFKKVHHINALNSLICDQFYLLTV